MSSTGDILYHPFFFFLNTPIPLRSFPFLSFFPRISTTMPQPKFACPLCGIELPKPEIYLHAESCEGIQEPEPPHSKSVVEASVPRASHVDPNAVPASLQQESEAPNANRAARPKPSLDSTAVLDARRQLRLDDLCRKHHRDVQTEEVVGAPTSAKEPMQLVTRDRLFTGLFGDPYITDTELEGGPVAETLGRLSGFLNRAAGHFKKPESTEWLIAGTPNKVNAVTAALEKASKIFSRTAVAEAMTLPVTESQPLQQEKRFLERAKLIRAQLLSMRVDEWAALPSGWVTRQSAAHAVTLLIHRTPTGFDWVLCNTGAGVNRHASIDGAFPKVKHAVAAPLGTIPSDGLSLAFLYFLVRANSMADENHNEEWFYEFLLPAQFGDARLALDPAGLPEEVGFPRSVQRAGTCYLKANLAALKVILSAQGLLHDDIKVAMLALRYVVLEQAQQSLATEGSTKGIYVSDEKLLRIACQQLLLKAERNFALGRVTAAAVKACVVLTDAI
jgi:hypothetical protein